MGKAEENKLIKRNALLSQAFSLFMDKGVANTSISDITEHAGVAKGTFYSYFTDKEDLIHKLIAKRGEQIFRHAVDAVRDREELSLEDTMCLMADDIIEQLISDARLQRFLNKNLVYGLYKKALINEGHKSESEILDFYYALIEKDDSEWEEPLLMLYTIVELVSSTGHSIILESDPVDYEHYKPYLFKCIRSIISVYRK